MSATIITPAKSKITNFRKAGGKRHKEFAIKSLVCTRVFYGGMVGATMKISLAIHKEDGKLISIVLDESAASLLAQALLDWNKRPEHM